MVADADIEREIHRQLSLMTRQDPESVTVNSVRTSVEQQLRLDSGFLKSGAWKARSKEIIQAGFDNHQAEPEPESRKSTTSSPHASETSHLKLQKKRKSATDGSKSKRQRKIAPDPPASESDEDAVREPSPAQDTQSTQSGEHQDRLLNDSELSDVIDEEPSRAKKSASKPVAKTTAKNAKRETKAAKKNAGPQLSQQQSEIKTLQSQLLKCGIRRMWANELKKFDSDKSKVLHLKGMLREVGMEGRFSEDKARKIKEEREFKADLADIRQGNEKWGRAHEEDENEEESDAQPRRRIARGLAQLDVFGDDEESE